MMLNSVSLRRNYSDEKSGFSGTLAVRAGDFNLRASAADDTSATWPTLGALSLSVEKPGSFAIEYDVPKKDVRFEFTKKFKVLEKPLNLTYTHEMAENSTFLNGMLELNSTNKVLANFAFDSASCMLKYSYARGGTTLEPGYDFGKNSWGFVVSQRILDDDLIRASYETLNKNLGLEWSLKSKDNKNLKFKISAFLDLAKGLSLPKLIAESKWDL